MRDKRRILVVDDNPENYTIIRDIFQDEYLLAKTTNGLDAICAAIRLLPDVVLLDVMMPGMDGIETCIKLRTIRGLKDTRIIMISAKAMPHEEAAGMRAGANVYLTKPFDECELYELVRCELERIPKSIASRC